MCHLQLCGDYLHWGVKDRRKYFSFWCPSILHQLNKGSKENKRDKCEPDYSLWLIQSNNYIDLPTRKEIKFLSVISRHSHVSCWKTDSYEEFQKRSAENGFSLNNLSTQGDIIYFPFSSLCLFFLVFPGVWHRLRVFWIQSSRLGRDLNWELLPHR